MDSLLAQRIAEEEELNEQQKKRRAQEEEELNEQQKKRRAQVQFEAQHYTDEDWDLIREKIEANAELSKSMLGSDLQGEDFAKKMVDLGIRSGSVLGLLYKCVLSDESLRLKATSLEFASFFRGQFQGLVWKFLVSVEFSRVQGELLSLAASVGFERWLSIHRTKDEFVVVLKKMANFLPGAQDRLAKSSPLLLKLIIPFVRIT
ncbi:hypothetical protein Tco_0790902 [Tanacetum coccineum]